MPFIQSSLEEGQTTFLLGQLHRGGHWSYFLVTLLFKTPLPFVAGILLALHAAVHRQLGARWQSVPLILAPGAYFAISMVANLNIGHRHLLPILPYLVVLIARSVDALLLPALGRSGYRRGIAIAIAGWYIIGTVTAFPHYLSYFNELAGGLDGGYRYLADSSTDWGQGLIALADHLEIHDGEHDPRSVYLAAFSSVDPKWYGLDYRPLPPTEQAAVGLPSRFQPHPGTYVISVAPLQGIWLLDPDTYDWFRHRDPVARVAHVYNVYEVVDGVEPVRRLVQCASPTPVLAAQTLAEGFEQADPGDVTISRTSTARRAGYILPMVAWLCSLVQRDMIVGMTRRLAGSTLSFARENTGAIRRPRSIACRVRRPARVHQERQHTGSARSAAPNRSSLSSPSVTCPVVTSGPLTFLGYDIRRNGARSR